MTHELTRREMLARSVAALSIPLLPAKAPAVREVPDRSGTAPTSPVSIQRCETYEPKLVREKLDAALDQIGGLTKLVENKTVTVKLNMTGPIREMLGHPAHETYHVHPNVVAAFCAACHDAGARRIVLVEAWYDNTPVEELLSKGGWDVAGIKSAGGQKVMFENTRNRGSWPDYARVKVPWGGYLFPAFDLNQWYVKTDVFVSLAKIKNHATAGVTMSLKNLFGITPTALYGNDAPNEKCTTARVDLIHLAKRKVPEGVPAEVDHGLPADPFLRVPACVADCCGARPIDLAVIEGVKTIKGGEGFWNKGCEYIEPKLLMVGRNGVTADAVCTAVMGYDPQAPDKQSPFPGTNHLRLCAQAGLGTIDLKQIEVLGLSIEQAKFPFGPLPVAAVRRGETAGLAYGGPACCPSLYGRFAV